mmetsp:Transcript_74994/g.87070  ORF Transcript_74994/g.87070 Transcript_74994/m.87070 type:complete len:204 (+) Transcript_74994:43-654(+)
MADTLFDTSFCKVLALLVLKNDGSRVYSKYYLKICPKATLEVAQGNLSDFEVQKDFEKALVEKSRKLTSSKTISASENEIFTYGQFNVVFKNLGDILFFVLGDPEENELVLTQLLSTFYEAMNYFTKNQTNKKAIMDNFDNVMLIIDELVDEGIIMTLDSVTVIARVTMKDTEFINIAQTDSSFSSAFTSAKSSIAKSLNLGK